MNASKCPRCDGSGIVLHHLNTGGPPALQVCGCRSFAVHHFTTVPPTTVTVPESAAAFYVVRDGRVRAYAISEASARRWAAEWNARRRERGLNPHRFSIRSGDGQLLGTVKN